MFPQNDYLWLKDYELNRLPAGLANAEQHRLLSEAGLIRRPWLSCQICRSLWQLGRMLVTAGQRLEQRYTPAALSPTKG
jgi:hypothetical protein